MKRIGALITGLILLLDFGWPVISQAEPEVPEVIINEMAWAGSTVSTSDEWIELKNTTDAEIDIAGWQINRLDAGGQQEIAPPMLTISAEQNHLIPAQGYFLVSNNAKDYHFSGGESVLNIDPDYIDSDITLPNSHLKIFLYASNQQLVDVAGDGGETPFCGGRSSTLSVAMERNTPYGLGELSSSWHEATTSVNLDIIEGANNLGTPRAENSLPPLAAPIISKVIPDQAEMDSVWEIEEIIGENFVTTGITQIKLEKGDLAIWATDIKIINSTSIDTAKFDLHGAETGKWDLVIINPDGQTATLPQAVEILEPEEEDESTWTTDADIKINELYPHPSSGEEEFIELYNAGDNPANLKGWKLDDQSPGGSAEYTIPTDIIIGPQQYLIFPKSQTHLYLNDTGDYSRLLQPNGNLLDSTPNYGTATAGYSYSKINGNWQWSRRVTPNAANIYESTAEEEDNISETDHDPTSLQPDEITIQLESDDLTANSVMLIWKINLPGAIGDIKIYQSEKKGQLGFRVGQTAPPKTEYLVTNLTAGTKYFFTIIGSYNINDIKSNQIEITTTGTKTAIGDGTLGTPKQIIISEILPNPNAGESEFIELHNPGTQSVDITGWKLTDASGKIYVLNALDLIELMIAENEEEDAEITSIILDSQDYLLLEYPLTHIRLNNSGGEELQLLDGEDNLIDEISYDGSAKQGYAYVLAPNDRWFWSNETTPGEENDISFASINEDGYAYLTDTGNYWHYPIFLWISALLSAIILPYSKRHGYPKLYHS